MKFDIPKYDKRTIPDFAEFCLHAGLGDDFFGSSLPNIGHYSQVFLDIADTRARNSRQQKQLLCFSKTRNRVFREVCERLKSISAAADQQGTFEIAAP